MKSQPEIQTINRRKELARIRRTKEYRDILAGRVDGQRCIWCGCKDKLTVHHISLQDYLSERTYIAGLYTGWVMCHRCHRAYHRGYILCPQCKEHYTKYNVCYRCMPAERKEEIERKKVMLRKLRKACQKKKYQEWKERRKRADKV